MLLRQARRVGACGNIVFHCDLTFEQTIDVYRLSLM
jgi:hypothetical protein